MQYFKQQCEVKEQTIQNCMGATGLTLLSSSLNRSRVAIVNMWEVWSTSLLLPAWEYLSKDKRVIFFTKFLQIKKTIYKRERERANSLYHSRLQFWNRMQTLYSGVHITGVSQIKQTSTMTLEAHIELPKDIKSWRRGKNLYTKMKRAFLRAYR